MSAEMANTDEVYAVIKYLDILTYSLCAVINDQNAVLFEVYIQHTYILAYMFGFNCQSGQMCT